MKQEHRTEIRTYPQDKFMKLYMYRSSENIVVLLYMENLYYKVDQSHFYVFYIAADAGTDNVVIPIASQLQTHPPKLN